MPSKKKQPGSPRSGTADVVLQDLPVSEKSESQVVGGATVSPLIPDPTGVLNAVSTTSTASTSVHTSPLSSITNVKG